MTISAPWTATAVIHVHPLASWKQVPQRQTPRALGSAGNVTFLPPPVTRYRIRHAADDVIVEIKPSHAPAIELARCASVDDARAVLLGISADHVRPFLAEIGRAA